MAPVLEQVLAEAQEHGFIGLGAIHTAIEHARGFAAGVPEAPSRVVDLGSGGGLPGLVLAGLWSDAHLTLVEANQRRARFLDRAIARLGFGPRVQVITRRAEVVGHERAFRGASDLVVARSFGLPAVTAECAAPLLRVGGRLVVSEPPAEGSPVDRWPPAALGELGLAVGPAWATEFRYQSLVLVAPCPDRYPRRVGVPAKRPLY